MAETGKSFIKKFVGFSLVTWVTFAVNFFTTPISTRLFSPEILGKINIFNTYANLFSVLVLIGLDQAFARFYLERPNNRSIGYLFSFCFGITYALLFGLILSTLPFRHFLSLGLFEETDNFLLYLFFISVFCFATYRYLNLAYRMEQDINKYTIQGVLWVVIPKIFGIGIGFWYSSYKLVLLFLTASHFLLIVSFLMIQRHRFERIVQFDKMFSTEMFKFALPLIPVSILMWANSSIPQIVMQKTMDFNSIGIFTSAVSLANVILVIQAGFNTFWVPYTYENYKTQTGQFYKVHRYLLCVLTLFTLVLVLFQDVVFLLLGEKYRIAKCFFPFLILGPVCYIIGETTGIGIDISKKTYYNVIVFCSSVFMNILLCVILRKPFGISGIAMALGFSGIIAMCLKTLIGQRLYRTVDSYKYVLVTTLLIVISAFVTLNVQSATMKNVLLFVLCTFSIVFFKKEILELKDYALSFVRK